MSNLLQRICIPSVLSLGNISSNANSFTDRDTDADDSEVQGLPRFVETIENVIATEDKDSEFRCKTNPDEIFDVKWYVRLWTCVC